jgi:hypothetical protein
MRKTAPKLILQGNQRLAKKWIPWATKALDRIKNLTGTGVVNKVLRPVTGVTVHVWSVNGIDRIRIAVTQKKGCKVVVTPTLLGGLDVEFSIAYTTEESDTAGWDFITRLDAGGRFLSGNNRYGVVTHALGTPATLTKTFAASGTYNVSFPTIIRRSIRSDSDSTDAPIITLTVDMTDISKAQGSIIVLAVGAVDVFVNDVFIGTTKGSEYANSILFTEPIIDTMVVRCEAQSGDVANATVVFEEYKCLATTTINITL